MRAVMGINLPTSLRLAILVAAGFAHHLACAAPSAKSPSASLSAAPAEHEGDSESENSRNDNDGRRDEESVSHDKFAFAVRPFLGLLSVSKYSLWTLIGLDGASCILSTLHPSKVPSSFAGLKSSPSLLPLSFLAGATLIIAGWRLRKACFDTLGKQFTLQHKMFRRHHLITTGPYRYVRHPGYVGVLLVRVGALSTILSKGSWARTAGAIPWPLTRIFLDGTPSSMMAEMGKTIVGLYSVHAALELIGLFCVRAPHEDAVLKERFGKEWIEYKERVPWMFVPLII